jgi:hypothetical protein
VTPLKDLVAQQEGGIKSLPELPGKRQTPARHGENMDPVTTNPEIAPQSQPSTPEGCRRDTGSPYRNWGGELMLNPSVEKADEKRLTTLSRQMIRVFREAFSKKRTVSTSELVAISAQYNSRVWEIRRWLVPQGFCIDLVKRGPAGENQYSVVRIEKSTFYRKHKEKLEAEAIR